MAFVIYAWCWVCGMENCVYPTCFALESLSIFNDHSLSSNTSFNFFCAILYITRSVLESLDPKIQQLHTVRRAVYLHRCCSLSNILSLMLKTHTVHFILRHETADISITIVLRHSVLCLDIRILAFLEVTRLSPASPFLSSLCLCLLRAVDYLFV